MLMEEFEEWIEDEEIGELMPEDDKDNFSLFYQRYCTGKMLPEILCAIAYEVYHLQVCIEGLIEDQRL